MHIQSMPLWQMAFIHDCHRDDLVLLVEHFGTSDNLGRDTGFRYKGGSTALLWLRGFLLEAGLIEHILPDCLYSMVSPTSTFNGDLDDAQAERRHNDKHKQTNTLIIV